MNNPVHVLSMATVLSITRLGFICGIVTAKIVRTNGQILINDLNSEKYISRTLLINYIGYAVHTYVMLIYILLKFVF